MFNPKWIESPVDLFIDVKTTTGPFENVVHMSVSEVVSAASTKNYRIARVYHLRDGSASIKILVGIHELAKNIYTDFLKKLPSHLKIDGFSIKPDYLGVEHHSSNYEMKE